MEAARKGSQKPRREKVLTEMDAKKGKKGEVGKETTDRTRTTEWARGSGRQANPLGLNIVLRSTGLVHCALLNFSNGTTQHDYLANSSRC